MQFAVEKEINEIPKVLKKRRKTSLKKFSSLLKEPILITGISSSIDFPGWGVEKLTDKMGINVKIRYTSEVSDLSANTVIALSFSGETEEAIQVLKKSKAKVKIAITGNKNSTLAEYATHVIPMICGEQISDIATKTVVEEYYIINQLILEQFGNYKPIEDKEIKQIKHNLELGFSREIINKFVSAKRVVIIGSRGLSEETETKFQELTKTQAEAILGPIIFYSAVEVLTQGEIILIIEPEKMTDYNIALKKAARVSDIIYINKLKIIGSGRYKSLIRYAGILNFIAKIGKAKSLDIDHPEILMRTVRGFKSPLFKDVKNVVVFGGGSGIPSLLKAFKKLSHNVCGITSMVDSGGSTGKLRKDYKVLAAGDIRRLIAALSDHPNAAEIINHRFKGGELNSHTFGNILFAALERVNDFKSSKEEIEKMLGSKGKAFPATTDNPTLYAELENGQILEGEDEIDTPLRNPFLKIKKVWLKPRSKIYPDAQKAILNADIIVIGPGDLYSSLIPNFLVKGVPEAIKKSKAKKVFVCNAMTKLGETYGYNVSKFVSEIEKYLGKDVLDFVVYNQRVPSMEIVREYQKEEPFVFDYVKFDRKKLSKRVKPEIVGADLFINPNGPILHDPDVLAKIILSFNLKI